MESATRVIKSYRKFQLTVIPELARVAMGRIFKLVEIEIITDRDGWAVLG